MINQEAPMTDEDTPGGGTVWRWLGLFLCGLGVVMMAGMVTGFLSEALKDESGLTMRDYAILLAMIAVAVALLAATWRLGRTLFGKDAAMPRRERASRNILIGCGVLGGLIGLGLAASSGIGADGDTLSLMSEAPIPPVIAILLAAVILLILPAISFYWHRVIDEHESAAYRDGAIAGAYLFMTLAPAWWFLWRGGLVPEPNGVLIYFAFNFVFLAMWFWKKYR